MWMIWVYVFNIYDEWCIRMRTCRGPIQRNEICEWGFIGIPFVEIIYWGVGPRYILWYGYWPRYDMGVGPERYDMGVGPEILWGVGPWYVMTFEWELVGVPFRMRICWGPIQSVHFLGWHSEWGFIGVPLLRWELVGVPSVDENLSGFHLGWGFIGVPSVVYTYWGDTSSEDLLGSHSAE